MAEAAVLATLGWVASPLVKMLIDKGIKLLGTSMDEKRKTLAATALPRLYLAIEKAEKSPKKHMLEEWLKKLKDAYYEAEDVIDLLEYQQLHLKVMEDKKTLKFEAKQLIHDVSENLKGHIDKIIEMANEAEKFSDLLKDLENDCTSNPDRVTTSQPLGIVFGLEDHKNTVVGLIKADCINKFGQAPEIGPSTADSINKFDQAPEVGTSTTDCTNKFDQASDVGQSTADCTNKFDQAPEVGPSTRPPIPIINIIAITGRSGIGKTTLAQHVYQHMEEKMCFDLLLWVHTPRKFKAIDVVKNIVQTIQKKNDALDKGNYDSSAPLEALREQMHRMLGSKKFLLVLDDFWCDDENFIKQWEKFISCLRGWSPGSKILLTTQYKLVEEQTSLAGETEVKTHTLGELTQDQLLKLFMHHAWPSNSSMLREKFENIGRDIVSKLKGDPGATKIVGRQLRNKHDIIYWENIVKKDWSEDNEMEARIWSYQQLPVHLQRCFAFFCLFPKGLGFTVSLLIDLWMAEGFINPIDEDTVENYINELVSFFSLEKYVDDGNTYYRLHDLLHDLAERVKGDDFVRIDIPEDKKTKLSQSHINNIRHISLPSGRMLIELKDEICLMKNLCTLLCIGNNLHIPKKNLQEILENLQNLRVLHLPSCDCELPDSIGNLKHLRSLNFGGNSSLPLNKLPTSICELYLLQTLDLPGCQSLPKEISQLISLRRIIVGGEATSHIYDIGRLTSLRCLHKFNVRAGHELRQLENLNQLTGTMCIAGLENVTNINDANKANLQSKGRLQKLEFHWSSGERVTNNDFQLLDALQPHSYIRGLKIKWFTGNKFPNWLLSQNSTLEHLVDLQLEDCSNVEEISSIGKSLPNCEVLGLSALNNLKELHLLPPNLTSLTLSDVPLLTYISKNDLSLKDESKNNMLEASEQTKNYMKSRYELELPQIDKIIITRYIQLVKKRWEDAPKICTESSQCENIFQEMKKMAIPNDDYSINELSEAMGMWMRWHFETMLNKNDESNLILPSSLTRLVIKSCSITNHALSTCIECLHSLSELQLVEIQTITSLPPERVLSTLKKLNFLHIEACYLLSSLGGISALSSLIELNLIGCLNLNSSNKLPSSLHILCFRDCAYIEDILDQSVLPELHDLQVEEFSKIGPNCERRGKGVLNVAHLHRLKLINYSCNDHVCLEGLNSLTSLHTLEVHNSIRLSPPADKCSIPIKLVIVDHNPLWLKEILSAQTLSSIENLHIHVFEENSMDDEMFQSLKSLKQLCLEHCNNITHLPVQLKDLTSLEYMFLGNCPRLHEVESIPNNLSHFHIKDCPTLSAKFNKSDDSYEVNVKDEGTCVFRKGNPTLIIGNMKL
ncbi:hypothetical protein LUZ61_005952 [Rhynchospora tenuis]|uniref:NB-ARC domain-containing protein n=1 Tax=Rhynchospora tenuis TaxID=198213 RepID=A0AAD5ZQQ1_9POAL|nr:hypothetical protein LUZ61_005952 [Rhynchospora tenuis]